MTIVARLLFLFCFTLNAQSALIITSPQNNARVKSGDFLSINWNSKNRNIQGMMLVEFSKNKRQWKTIDQVNVNEGNVFWEVPKIYNSDGIFYVRVSSVNKKRHTKTITLQYNNQGSNFSTASLVNKKRNYNTRYTGKFVKIEIKKDNIRSSPSAERGNIIGHCKAGQYYELLGREGRWYIIKYDNQRGYAFTHQTNGSLVTEREAQKVLKRRGMIDGACSFIVEMLILAGLAMLL